jgi:hypothetical protein
MDDCSYSTIGKRSEMRHFFPIAFFILVSLTSGGQVNLDSLIRHTDCILLGEQAHGVRSFYRVKRDLIRQIEIESERDLLILTESPLVLSITRQFEGGAADYYYPHTNTQENLQFFKSYQTFGFDLQEDCRHKEFGNFLVTHGYVSGSDRDLRTMDSILSLCILGDHYIRDVLSVKESSSLQSAILELQKKVLSGTEVSEDTSLLKWCFDNRLYLANYLQLPVDDNYMQRIKYRDSIMSVNIGRFLSLYEERTSIVWAANLHIGKKGVMGKRWTSRKVRSMAEHLEQDFELYRIAVAAKPGRKEEKYYDELLITKERKLVDEAHLQSGCK